MNVADALTAEKFTVGQFDWVLLDSAVSLTSDQKAQVQRIARLAIMEVSGQVWELHDVREATTERVVAMSSRLREAP